MTVMYLFLFSTATALIPTNSQDVVRLLKSMQPLLQDAIQKKRTTRLWDHVYTITGPLTWKDFHLLAGRGADETSEPQPIPPLLVGYEKDWIKMAPHAVRYWVSTMTEWASEKKLYYFNTGFFFIRISFMVKEMSFCNNAVYVYRINWALSRLVGLTTWHISLSLRTMKSYCSMHGHYLLNFPVSMNSVGLASTGHSPPKSATPLYALDARQQRHSPICQSTNGSIWSGIHRWPLNWSCMRKCASITWVSDYFSFTVPKLVFKKNFVSATSACLEVLVEIKHF